MTTTADICQAFGCTLAQAAQASQAMSLIPDKIAAAKKANKKEAQVFRIPLEEYAALAKATKAGTEFSADLLTGATRLVYLYCVQKGHKPAIDNVGFPSEPYIVAHW